jgi:hypothetical protein
LAVHLNEHGLKGSEVMLAHAHIMIGKSPVTLKQGDSFQTESRQVCWSLRSACVLASHQRCLQSSTHHTGQLALQVEIKPRHGRTRALPATISFTHGETGEATLPLCDAEFEVQTLQLSCPGFPVVEKEPNPVRIQPNKLLGGPNPESGDTIPRDVSYVSTEKLNISHNDAMWKPGSQAVNVWFPWKKSVDI